ncbi:GtrA family protein [Methylomicrobium lacus]|uniref:GtrA family protein n=1 Tax=Methylomicrobium lacus TaxID=136992 RepID=UPI0035A8A5F0
MPIHKFPVKLLPVRFILFVIVGLIGSGFHLLTLWIFHLILSLQFISAQAIAIVVAMTGNYFINNNFTFRDKRIRGIKLLSGLFSFYLVCSVGAVISMATSYWLYHPQQNNWILAAMAGAIAGSLWNYYFSSLLTWKDRKTL